MSLFAGTPADILPLVEAFPKCKDMDKRRKDKGLYMASLRVAGAAQLSCTRWLLALDQSSHHLVLLWQC